MASDGVTKADVQALATRISETIGTGPFVSPGGWHHMGAVICDACLSRGLNYETVVRPKVVALQEAWPDATTTTTFLNRSALEGTLEAVLDFRGQKPQTARALAHLLADDGVETREDLAEWIVLPGNRDKLLAVKGIKDKTADYLALLVGVDEVAVDRHIRDFVAEALPSLATADYDTVHALVVAAAGRLGLDQASGLEHAIWQHQADRH